MCSLTYITVVSCKYAPLCNLSLSTKRRGGLYVGCDIFSRDYAPPASIEKIMFSGSVHAGFLLALQFDHGDFEPDCVGVSTKGGGLCAE